MINSMFHVGAIVLALLWPAANSRSTLQDLSSEEGLANFLENVYEKAASDMCTKQVKAAWDFETDVANKVKEEAQLNATLQGAQFDKNYWDNYFKDLSPDDYNDEVLKRQVKELVILGRAALDPAKLEKLTNIGNSMTNIYSTARVCPPNNIDCDLEKDGLNLEPDIETIMSTSKNYSELTYVWTKWRDATGLKIKNEYKEYVELSNEAARANKFDDMGKMWIEAYESPNFIKDMDKLWEQVQPLYHQLHKYVSKKLKELYKDEIDVSDGLIPAHVLGNMWAQSWVNLYDLVVPYPDASSMDVTKALKEQNYTVLKMFEVADEFYQSMGLEPNGICYDTEKGAMIEKPKDRDVLCHASAWDFCDGQNYRVKMCTEVDYEYFIVVHHEMGHIQYYLQYATQPITLRTGANPGFHEAIGDTIALSVATPKHLKAIELLKDFDDTPESSINALMKMALERVAFLPFGLLIDKWRWDVFAGRVPYEKWNSHWWHYRNTIQKVKAPAIRSDEKDFDPGAKYHVAGDSQYINYFVAHILQFQLYRGLCKTAGEFDPNDQTKPLHNCDFYKSTAAGNKLSAGLRLGSSEHWKQALKAMTGETELDASALLEYFQPLMEFLNEQNNPTEEELEAILEKYNEEASAVANKQVKADWQYATDINEENEKEKVKVTLETAEFTKLQWNNVFRYLDENDYKKENIRREVKFLKVLGNAALDTDKLAKLTEVGNNMTAIYSTGAICPYKKQQCDLEEEGIELEPDITQIFAASNDYDELLYTWEAWRDQTGAKMKDYYKTYVDLSNEAAVINGYADKGEMWRGDYESDTFIDDMDKLWEQVKPLYNELHRYVRNKLKELYKDKLDVEDGLIPAHILGNMWAQAWNNLPIEKPYPNASAVNITEALQKKTIKEMFEMSNEFYTSMGLADNSMSYGDLAMIEKPDNRSVLCHASAWDFSDGLDFRIKMCTDKTYKDFITIHHEMGHIQYFIQYKKQNAPFRTSANPGFHEAVGDTIALSVATPKHLKEVGLVQEFEDSDEASINSLMDMALERVAFLPFGLLIDKWRWDVFAGLPAEEWNSQWWHYRKTIQKIKPPVERTEEDFDPGAKYHVPGDSQYINYFVAHILEFQLYRGLCKAAHEYDPEDSKKPLHKCDFYRSKDAGSMLSKGLELGASKHWRDALEVMTGERDLDATALLEYFDPLLKYLRQHNGPLNDDKELKNFLQNDYESSASKNANRDTVAQWNYLTDVNNATKEQESVNAALRASEFTNYYYQNYFKTVNNDSLNEEENQRQIRSLQNIGKAALGEEKLKELTELGNEMNQIYSSARICPYNKQDCDLNTEGLTLEPDIEDILANSEDYGELKYVWESWRDQSGRKIKDHYPRYVQLSNEAAKANGFNDTGDLWISDYETDNFVQEMDDLWKEVEPLYDQLHQYVGNKLKSKYGNDIDISDGLIPAHVFGNMWAQSWQNIFHLVKPYPEASEVNITAALKEQGYTALRMFETSDEFYQSLGLESNAMSYSELAVIEKPKDRDILCHASAWDFSDGKDFRIKMCTTVTHKDFIVIHHEMGHIQYFILYKDQPITFRGGANGGFHEAVGDTIALSVSSPKHLQEIGLLKDYKESKEADLNALMDMALERVAFLPFGLLIDKWRWDVFAGKVDQSKWNAHWWEYRKSFQKVKAPVERSDENDFDPGAKYHIPGDSQYINYFVARILQFQFYKALCKEAGEYEEDNPEKPLYKCDFYRSKAAGQKFRNGLSLGSSKHWSIALKEITGETKLSASALLEYFAPLMEYLQEQNKAEVVDENTSQLVPIVVGSVLGGILVIAIAVYIYKRTKQR